MPGIGWNCKCGKTFEEGVNFTWKFECAKLNCSEESHSEECEGRDWQSKETAFKEIVDKHLAVCSKCLKCKRCNKSFMWKEKLITVSEDDPRVGYYHKTCWVELEKDEEKENQPKCERCRINKSEIRLTIKKGGSEEEKLVCQTCHDKYQKENNNSDDSIRERERETKSEQFI